MNEAMMSSALLLAGVLIGALLVWASLKSRVEAQIQAAVAQREGALQSEMAQLTERLRFTESLLEKGTADAAAFSARAEGWRTELDRARDEVAGLTERASRVATLEEEVASLREQLQVGARESRSLSEQLAQRTESAESLSAQLKASVVNSEELTEKLCTANKELNAANERKAALEELAAQVPGLKDECQGLRQTAERLNTQLADVRESSGMEKSRLEAELAAEREVVVTLRADLAAVKADNSQAHERLAKLNDEFTELKARTEAESGAAEEKINLLVQAKEALSDQFKSLANDILEEKSKRFAEQNQTTLGQMLDPLRTQLTEFKGKVEEVYVQEGKDRTALSEQVRQLLNLNQALSQDAKNLTQALKGSAKTQGNWGELILERVLESSGLRKGFEYVVQDSQLREDGSRAQPDVVINLPEERRLVVDAKVSLVAYDEHVSADDDAQREAALRRHIDSIRGHIKGLSEKQYQALYGLNSLDFVLMFVPIEPAFMLAVAQDNKLFMEAWERNVLLVSPSTLLFVVRTVAHLWRQEQQSRNAQEIAKRGAELYDRLVGFADDLQEVGKKLKQAQDSFDSAQKKLSTNKGNVIRQAEMLKDLGVKPSKALPVQLVEMSLAETATGMLSLTSDANPTSSTD